ncbi:MAG: antiterminator LoaP [Spirochaetota bacterium]
MNFFAIQVKTRGEEKYLKLARYLLDTHRLLPPGKGRLIWPRRRLVVRRRGILKNSLAPIFPGYLFIETDRIEADVYWILKRINGFFRFLKSNHEIEPLEGKDKQLLLHFLSFGEIVNKSAVYFDENKRIRVVSGPLKGLEGEIVKVDKRKKRAKIKLALYKDSFMIDFGFELLEPAEQQE